MSEVDSIADAKAQHVVTSEHAVPATGTTSTAPHGPTLQIDFSWKKSKARITDPKNPSETIYIVDFRLNKPNLVIEDAKDHSQIGTGTLSPIKIDAEFDVRGWHGIMKALKRWKTNYTHLSYAYSETAEPIAMEWTSSSDFKTWDFVCVDDKQTPVAKFSANAWNMNKVGNIEFLGPKADDPAAREETLVAGLTLVYCMMLRTNSLLSFFGAFFASPGPIKQDEHAAGEKP